MGAFRRGRRAGKYLKKLLLTIAVVMVAIVVAVSSVMYYGAEKAMVELNLTANQKMLSQLKFNIDYMNENLKSVVMTQYFDNRNYPLMNAEHIEAFEMLSRLQNLDRIVNSSPFLHSIVMYNAIQDQYYTGGRMEMFPESDPILSEIDRYRQQHQDIPKLRLIPLKGKGPQEEGEPEADVFAMFMYEGNAGYSPQKSMLVVNIQAEWLFDNLNLLNAFVDNERGTIGIMDQHGYMFYPTIDNLPLEPDFKTSVRQRIQSEGLDSNQFVEWDGKELQVVTYMDTGLNDWKMIIVQPYKSLLQRIDELKQTALWLIFGFILAAIACSIFISRRLYRPIRRLVQHIRPASQFHLDGHPADSSAWKDELRYIEHAYKGMLTSLQSIQRAHDEHRAIVRSYYARTIVLEGPSLSQAAFEQQIRKQQLCIEPRGVYRLVALQMDEAARFRDSYSAAEQKLLRFALRNIAEHVFSAAGQVEWIEGKEDWAVLLLSAEEGLEEPPLVLHAQRVQEALRKYYRLSLTVTLGDLERDYRALSGSCGRLEDRSLYRMVSGHGSVITPGMVQTNVAEAEGEMQTLNSLEKKMADAIRMNHKAEAEEGLEEALSCMRKLPPDQLMHSLLALLTHIRHALSEVNKNRLQAIHIGWNRYIREVTELETLADAHMLFAQLLTEIADKQANEQKDTHRVLVETIKEIIETRYADLNLSLQTIADALGMSPAYVSRVFRKAESVAIHAYIRETRLQHALRLLETSDSPIADIMERVGYGNVSNFFRHFKKRYGTTPKEYRLKRSIENHSSTPEKE
ncbi:helix-turn-helix domain-containing protein [Xylanibacillus composti]|uniref:AraC family transcriptional regulator n=1 Tax=Xylanibacillus composti TaxID=1572762 RepID=A0A8J4M3S8_9BACL|nr:AraC family transcriptional regulator [Xylanibacillus composti]MDT9725712.1 helix-turn-helix domain-containing protein [Xylanibacillus composti]GIQ71149.1 hypothetical protein XYCOK13_39730 [Xylanibacillus composti]